MILTSERGILGIHFKFPIKVLMLISPKEQMQSILPFSSESVFYFLSSNQRGEKTFFTDGQSMRSLLANLFVTNRMRRNNRKIYNMFSTANTSRWIQIDQKIFQPQQIRTSKVEDFCGFWITFGRMGSFEPSKRMRNKSAFNFTI